MTQYPVVIEVTRTKDDLQVKATTSIELVLEGGNSLETELGCVETDYKAALVGAGAALASAGRGRCRDPKAYWLAGRYLAEFFDRLETRGFYLVEKNKTPARHLGVSESSIRKMIAFHRRYADPRKIDPSISWSAYRENRAP
jgi:hypothetical protein